MNVTLTERPPMLPAAWAQVCGVRIRSASGVARDLLVGHPSVRVMAAHAPQLPQVHQVSNQVAWAEAQARVQTVPTAAGYGTNGTTGFLSGDMATVKQIVGRVSGAPPRGRPV